MLISFFHLTSHYIFLFMDCAAISDMTVQPGGYFLYVCRRSTNTRGGKFQRLLHRRPTEALYNQMNYIDEDRPGA